MNNKKNNRFFGICCASTKALIFLALTCFSSATLAAQLCATNPGNWGIADNNTTNAIATFNFGDAVSTFNGLSVDVDISHTWVGDLDATLTSPGNISVVLFDRPGYTGTGNGCNRNDINAIFSDNPTTTTNVEGVCPNTTPTISGSFYAQAGAGAMAPLLGGNLNGSWNLAVTDNANQDIGSVNSYCLNTDVPIAGLTLTKYASTDPNCTDSLTSITVANGTNVYYCYAVTNTGDYPITIGTGAITDDKGIDVSSLEGLYGASGSGTETKTLTTNSTIGPIVAGTGLLPANTTTTNTVTLSSVAVGGGGPALNGLPVSKQASVAVQPSLPSTGNKPLYLDSSPASDALTRVAVSSATSLTLAGQSANSWKLATVTKDLLVDGSGTIPITLMLSESGPGSWRDYTMTLWANNGTERIATLSLTNQPLTTTPTAYTYALVMDPTWTSGDNTVNANQDIWLTISNDRTLASGRNLLIQDMGSQVTLPALTVINVDSVAFYDSSVVTQLNNVCAGSTIIARAIVSDPFGSADINPTVGAGAPGLPTIAFSGLTPNPASYTVIESSSTTGTKTYDFTFTVPAAASTGTLQADVTATEGYEGSPITHTAPGTLTVINGAASLTISKNANKASAKPGELITYTATVANSGTCPATALEANDKLGAYLALAVNPAGFSNPPFNFNLTNTSGLSTLVFGTPDYSSNGGSTWGYSLSSGAGGALAGYDGLVTNWKIPFTGDLQVGDSFTLQYGATVK